MAKFIAQKSTEVISLEDFIDEMNAYGPDILAAENIDSVMKRMSALYNNRHFLTHFFNQNLRDISIQQANLYTFQVFMISRQKYYDLRAPVWFPQVMNKRTFAYDIAHDHNFDLVTMGYSGSGYTTEIYQYDASQVCGQDGEAINLFNYKKVTLHEGSVLLYEKNKDLHIQHPPSDVSVSFNLIKTVNVSDRQYMFDVKNSCILRKAREPNLAGLLKIAEIIGDEETEHLINKLNIRKLYENSKT